MAAERELDQMLRSAITEKHLIRFQYKNNQRIVAPRDYGIQNGIVRLFCWQVSGKSSGDFSVGNGTSSPVPFRMLFKYVH